MDYLYRDLGTIGPDDLVEVILDHAANVLLLDPGSLQAYKNRTPYRYYGGHIRQSPYRINPPFEGHWHLIIDLGGGPGTVKAAVNVYPATVAS